MPHSAGESFPLRHKCLLPLWSFVRVGRRAPSENVRVACSPRDVRIRKTLSDAQ
jgi:hypothetical protein